MRRMSTAPRDGKEIMVRSQGRWRRARYHDCKWLRDPFVAAPGLCMDGIAVNDCWRTRTGSDIELEDAIGWRPVR